jgi:rfaE bifunctional protein kinase chain/domain
MQNLSRERANEIITGAANKKIAVVGDVMLDRYFWGGVSRISPEAPVPVVDVESETYHLGGAANVAKNLKSLGLEPLLCGVIGNDNSGKSFIDICEKIGLDSSGLYIDDERPTTVKTRVFGNNQQLLRLDREVRDELSDEGEHFILDLLDRTKGLAGIIFEDYNKGTISDGLIREVISRAKQFKVPVFVDPKFANFFTYKGVTVFKPNRKEAKEALSIDINTPAEVEKAGKMLLEKLDSENILLTLGKDGMMLFEKNGDISSVPTRARNVSDVSGAGDTAIATLAAAIAGNANIKEAAALANYASGVVCEQPGIVSIKVNELLETVARNGVNADK